MFQLPLKYLMIRLIVDLNSIQYLYCVSNLFIQLFHLFDTYTIIIDNVRRRNRNSKMIFAMILKTTDRLCRFKFHIASKNSKDSIMYTKNKGIVLLFPL